MRLSALVLCGSLAGCVATEGDESFVIVSNLAFSPEQGEPCTPSKTGTFFSRLDIGFTQDATVCSLFESRVTATEGRESLRTITIEGANVTIEVGEIFIENPIDATVEVRGATAQTVDVTVLFSSSLPPNGGIAAGIYDVIPQDIMAEIRA